MRFIAYGDVHYSSSYRGLTLEDFVEIEEMIAAEARKEPDNTTVLFLGDRFLSRSPSYRDIEASERGLAAFEGLPYIALVGNHDRLSKSVSSEHTLMHWASNRYPNVTVLDKAGWYHIGYLSIFAIPAGQFPQVEEIKNEVPEGNIGVCLFHDIYQNSMVHASGKRLEGTATSIMDQEFFQIVLGGDNHVPQELPFKNTEGWHLGAPLQMNWGDKGINRGFWEFRVDEVEVIDEKFHDTNKPQFVDLQIDARDLEHAMEQLEFKQRCGEFHEDDILRIKVTCEKDSDITKNFLESDVTSKLHPRHVEVTLDFKHQNTGAELVRKATKMTPESRFETYLKLRGAEDREQLTQLLTDLLKL
jgi:DNA repair exonuclease SbcCD nuclease subunit